MRKLSCIPNDALLAAVRSAVRSALDGERNELVEFLRALGELDARRLYLELGFSSLYRYCREGLGLSEDQAYRRVACCRIGYRFPSVLSMLASGELHMSGLTKLAPHLNETNHAELIEASRGRSKEQIELMLAAQFGRPKPRTSISPTSAEVYEFRFAASARAKVLLDRAKALKPDLDVGEIFEAALEGLVAKMEKNKFKTTERPRSSPSDATAGDPHVSAAVKCAVFARDDGRCTFRGANGHRCRETARLEFDHIIPTARGGKSVAVNLRLLCRSHNQHAADLIYGRDFMEAKRRSNSPCPGKVLVPKAILSGLRNLGFVKAEAQRLIDRITPQMAANSTEVDWIRCALRASRLDSEIENEKHGRWRGEEGEQPQARPMVRAGRSRGWSRPYGATGSRS